MATQDDSFYGYFRQNMNAIGLPAPEQLYGTVGGAVGAAKMVRGYIEKFGPRVTVSARVLGNGGVVHGH
jgi:hypothetical protein